jgi:D-3-phosphoglycerate dehydrogenase
MAMLTLCRDALKSNDALHNKEWKKNIGLGLSGLNILIIGYGGIGRRVIELCKAFKPNIYVVDPYVNELVDKDVKMISLEEGLKLADVISLHASGVEEIIGENQFAIMKEDVILLNSSRGELVSEEALLQNLDSRKIKATWFDAFWEEPYTGRLTEYDNAFLTPHIGTYTKQCRKSMETDAVENLLRDLGL